jgi:hypothetical protein
MPKSGTNDKQYVGLTKFFDPVVMANTGDWQNRPNPITEKYFILTRDIDDSVAADLKPDENVQKLLNDIINAPDFIMLNQQQKTLIWKYRYSLIT